VRTGLVWALGFAALTACTSEIGGSGASCTRSAQCELGLACIEGACSDDLDALRDQSTVPMLMADPPPEEEPPPQAGEEAPQAGEEAPQAGEEAPPPVPPADGG
jgi:hypothetical protein